MRLAFRVLALILFLALASKVSAQVADPAPEPVLAYEGRLVESGTPVTGVRSFVFSIVDSNGDELWSSGTLTLTVTGGLYGVVLGAAGMPALPASLTLRANLSLSVNINGVQLSPNIALIPALQASAAWNVIGPFLGDVSGTQQTISVDKLKGTPIDMTVPPSAGEVLTFNGTSWIAAAISAGAGSEGPAGPQGPQGVAGPAGPPGAIGPMGFPGAPGAQGQAGVAGPAGAAGANGSTILSGAIDPTPAVGADGDFYINTATSTIFGPRVADTWPAGISLVGATGAQGPVGPAGTAGQQGTQGIQGFVGPSGPQGPAGAAGTNGSGFDFRSAFNASASYAIDNVITYNGSTYVAIAASAGPNNPTPDTNPSAWSVMAEEGAPGAPGAAGAAGAAGSAGSQGPQGIPGASGAPGAAGPQGPAGASPFTLDGSNAVFTTGSVGIGVDPPSSTAELDITSTTKGLLAPRMTTAQRLAIASPANGLIVYDTQLVSLEVYDAVGAVWNQLADTATTGSVTSVTASAPLSVTNGTSTPAITLGTVPVANGGTGATTLTGYLLGSGTSAVTASATIPGTAISGNIAGNAANVTGTVAVANGGTGAATAAAALTNLLPSQTGDSGKVLTTNGTAASWGAASAGTVTSVTGTSPIVVATGTSTPAITLATVPVANGGTGATTFTTGYLLLGNGTSAIGSSTLFWNSANGRLGLGTTTPSYPLDIETSVNANIGSYEYLAGGGTGSGGSTNGNFGIYVSNRMLASEFDAISDARIKNVTGPSDTAADLATLEKLKITDYRYIDVVGKGNQLKKGVIAQEVEKVYPDAVRTLSDFIPSVYAMADDVRYNEATHELTVSVPKVHGFAVGDVVRIITDAGNVDKPVASVVDDHTFVLADVENAASKVFVFGKKVDDFRVVDYDQLFSMNIGATQQLAIENQTLMKENAAITAENEAIKIRLAALERAVANLQKHK
jgi:hypothetical protein